MQSPGAAVLNLYPVLHSVMSLMRLTDLIMQVFIPLYNTIYASRWRGPIRSEYRDHVTVSTNRSSDEIQNYVFPPGAVGTVNISSHV